jgi:hypothetical protein
MIFPQFIRQGDTARCDQNVSGSTETWASVSPWFEALNMADDE